MHIFKNFLLNDSSFVVPLSGTENGSSEEFQSQDYFDIHNFRIETPELQFTLSDFEYSSTLTPIALYEYLTNLPHM